MLAVQVQSTSTLGGQRHVVLTFNREISRGPSGPKVRSLSDADLLAELGIFGKDIWDALAAIPQINSPSLTRTTITFFCAQDKTLSSTALVLTAIEPIIDAARMPVA